MLAACILSYDMYTFLIVFQLSYQIQMRQFDNWPSKSKLREQVLTPLRDNLSSSTLANQYIMKEINVGTGLATSYHSLTHPDPLIKYYLPCENTLFCFDFHVVPKHQRLVLKTEAHGWNCEIEIVWKAKKMESETIPAELSAGICLGRKLNQVSFFEKQPTNSMNF